MSQNNSKTPIATDTYSQSSQLSKLRQENKHLIELRASEITHIHNVDEVNILLNINIKQFESPLLQ